ncbi:MAG: glycoside hydrolase family 31 protein, partial [Lachnospiraceae bacterium]|nr:glycoside hydrolase family 31 protein [Lachnospiraceae bacterium]
YTRELMKEAHEKGTPVMRTLFYEFPEDKNAWEAEDEFMYGSRLLVAPVLEAGAISRKVYLPAGNKWENVETKEIYEGGQWITAPAPMDVIPVFKKID